MGKPTFARVMVQKGIVKEIREAFDTIFKWLEENMDTRKTVMKDILGKDMCFEYLTADFKSVDELIGNFKYDILVEE